MKLDYDYFGKRDGASGNAKGGRRPHSTVAHFFGTQFTVLDVDAHLIVLLTRLPQIQRRPFLQP